MFSLPLPLCLPQLSLCAWKPSQVVWPGGDLPHQLSSAGGNAVPTGHMTVTGDIVGCQPGVGVLLASRRTKGAVKHCSVYKTCPYDRELSNPNWQWCQDWETLWMVLFSDVCLSSQCLIHSIWLKTCWNNTQTPSFSECHLTLCCCCYMET